MSAWLEEVERIKQLKYAYSRAIDTCDIATLRALFTEDADIDYRGGSYHFQMAGRENILGALESAFHARFVGSHTVHMPVIELKDDGTAEGLWTLLDYAHDLDSGKTTVGAAHYRDRYVKQDGSWRIRHSGYVRVYERVYQEEDVGLTAHMLAAIHAAR